MTRSLLLAVAGLFVVPAIGSALRAADAPTVQMTVLGKALFEDDLTKGLGAGWTAAKGTWVAHDGAVRAAEVKSDMHGAVARHAVIFTDGVVAFEFKLDGVRGASLSLNGAKGHICRVALSPKKFTVNKDDQDGKNGPDKGEILGTGTVELKPGTWHAMVVEFRGPEILATLDGKHHAYGHHPAIEKEKTNLGLTAAGEFVDYRHLKVFQATANPAWEKTKVKIVAPK